MKRAGQRTILGVAIGTGAPAGWLASRWLAGASPLDELARDPLLYLYLLVPTAIAVGVFGRWVGLHEDRLEEMNRRLDELAVTDPLTGLKNVRYFRARLAEARAAVPRAGPLAVAVLDLDRFKRVNDLHGHVVGDAVLAEAARAIATTVRQGETAARVGGEEFALLLPGTGAEGARAAGERVRRAIAAARVRLPAGAEVAITASVGVAATDLQGELSADALYAAADAALFEAKRLGRDRVVLAAPPAPEPAVSGA